MRRVGSHVAKGIVNRWFKDLLQRRCILMRHRLQKRGKWSLTQRFIMIRIGTASESTDQSGYPPLSRKALIHNIKNVAPVTALASLALLQSTVEVAEEPSSRHKSPMRSNFGFVMSSLTVRVNNHKLTASQSPSLLHHGMPQILTVEIGIFLEVSILIGHQHSSNAM